MELNLEVGIKWQGGSSSDSVVIQISGIAKYVDAGLPAATKAALAQK
jgi:hypothetical protein